MEEVTLLGKHAYRTLEDSGREEGHGRGDTVRQACIQDFRGQRKRGRPWKR